MTLRDFKILDAKMMEGNINDEYLDDPIRLFDFERTRVFSCIVREDVIIEIPDDVIDKEHRTEHEEALYSYKNNSSILPVTFFDIESNVEFLKQCCPLSIKLVDCDKFPWYFKKDTDLRKHNKLNPNENNLQEADCIEIISLDENENYDTILERTTSEDMMNIHKEFNRIRFESDNNAVPEKESETKMSDQVKGKSFPNNSKIDFKKNKGIIGLKILQTNVLIDTETDKTNTNSRIYDQNNFVDTKRTNHADKTDAYARIIDKAYQKLKQVIKSPDHETHIQLHADITKYSKEEKNKNKSKTHESYKYETTKSKTDIKNNLNDCTKIKNSDSPKLLKSKTNVNKVIQIHNSEELPISENVLLKEENQISNKNKIKNVFQELQLKGNTLVNNNSSCSPILPCQIDAMNKNNNPKKIKIISDTPLSSNTKNNIKNNLCKNHLFSSNRVIPHYHNELVQTRKKNKLSTEYQNISKKSTRNEAVCIQNAHKTCRVNDFNYNNQSSLKECDINKQSRVIDGNEVNINNIIYNNHFISNNQISSLDRLMPNLCTKQCPQPNFSQEPTANKINVSNERPRRPELTMANDSVLSLDATKGNISHPISAGNNIPVILRQKPQRSHQNNETMPIFPIQRIISNRDYFQTNNFIVAPQNLNIRPSARQHIQDISQTNIYSNYTNNNFYISENSICSTPHSIQNTTNFNENMQLASSLHSIPLLPLTTINHIPQHKINNHHPNYIKHNENTITIENVNRNTISLDDRNTSVNRQRMIAALLATDYGNQKARRTQENTKGNVERDTTAYVHQHPYLKKSLEESPSEINNSDHRTMETNQQTGQNNSKDINLDKSRNRQNVENIQRNVGREGSAYVNKHPNLRRVLEQSPLKINKTALKHAENNQQIGQNNINCANVHKSVNKGYSPPILPIPTYQKTFEILAKVKLYDLEKESLQPEPNNNVTGGYTASENLRKRKLNDTEKLSRKISVSEYKKRLSAVESINVED